VDPVGADESGPWKVSEFSRCGELAKLHFFILDCLSSYLCGTARSDEIELAFGIVTA
jgi:hypothetical protein